MLFLGLCLLVLGCRKTEPHYGNSIVRLYPTGELFSLFDCTTSEFETLKSQAPTETVESFFRIEANRFSKPGKIIPFGESWTLEATGSFPGKLVFSAFAVTSHPSLVSLKVTIEHPGMDTIQEVIVLKGRAISHIKWEDFELNVVLAGSVTVTMECIFDDPTQRESSPWVFIGAPMFISRNRETEYPNIVLFVPDTLRADHLGCYGMPDPLTPTLDTLSRFSDLFETVYGTSSWTRPTVNSIFTGLYPNKNKVLGAPFSQFHHDYELLTDQLAKIGFLTLGVSGNDLVSPISEYDRGFDHYDSGPGLFATSNSTKQIQTAIMNLLPNPNDTPFFLYVHCMDPHDHYVPPRLFNEMFSTSVDQSLLRPNIQKGVATITINDVLEENTPPLTNDELAFLHSRYKGEIRYMDSMVDTIVREFIRRYPDQSFIFIVLSDHGEAFLEHGYLSHGFDLSQETIRLPLILSRLDPMQKPRLLTENVSQVDVLNTVLGFLNKTSTLPNDGLDIYAAQDISDRTIYSFLGNMRDLTLCRRAAIRGDRKLLYLQDSPITQFYLDKDPGEKNPIPVSETVSDSLYDDLNAVLMNEPSSDGNYVEPEKITEMLQTLGYVH